MNENNRRYLTPLWRSDPGLILFAGICKNPLDRIQSLCDQTLEAKLLCDPDQVLCAAKRFLREPDIVGRFLEQFSQQFAPGTKRVFTQILPRDDIIRSEY
jgi:hypothetical protein